MYKCSPRSSRSDRPVEGTGIPILVGVICTYRGYLYRTFTPPSFWDLRILGPTRSRTYAFWDLRVRGGGHASCSAALHQVARFHPLQVVIRGEPRTWPSLTLQSTGPSNLTDCNRAGIFRRGRMEMRFGTISLFAFGGRAEGQRGCQDCQ